MFGIRTKLSIVFIGLLLIIALVGIKSIVLFDELGGSIDLILRENYESVIACQDMKESLDSSARGLLYTLMGHEHEGKTLVDKNTEIFNQALKRELQNVTLPGEGQKAFLIHRLFKDYSRLSDTMLDRNLDHEKRSEVYFKQVLPLIAEIKSTANEILEMNQNNMNAANENARTKAHEAKRAMMAMITFVSILSAAFMLLIGRWIFRPISTLTEAANEIKSGNLEVVVSTNSRDEIGSLGNSLDAMAASLREGKRFDQAHLDRIRRSTEQAFNIIPDGIAIVDDIGNIEVANTAASELFDLKANRNVADLPLQLLTQMYYQAINAKSITESDNQPKLIQRFVEGEEKFFLPRAIPIHDSSKCPTGVLMLISDVTQEHHHNELKKSVISITAHQLRTPLTSVRMALHLLLDEKMGSLTDKQLELTLAAKEDSERLHLIIEQLLSIGRIESGKTRLDYRKIPSRQLVFDAVEPFRKMAIDRGLTLEIDLPDDLPDVDADPFLGSQVLANLLSNSLKYTQPGGVISVNAECEEEFVKFSVADTGKGIPKQYLNKILDQFFRVPGQGRGTGIGLGLAIVQEIITAHGGKVDVESVEGRGSRFTVSFKRANDPLERA